MSRPPGLTLRELVSGLLSHGERYHAISVFADDIEEVRSLGSDEQPSALTPLDAEGKAFRYKHEGKQYRLVLSADGTATLCVASDNGPPDPTGTAIVGALAGAAIGSATTKKGQGWATGLVLGLLAGAMLGSGGTKPARRILTMRFDPESRTWGAYDGGLVAWMKSELRPAT